MKHISIIVPDGQSNLSTIACIVGAYEIFVRANAYWKENGNKDLYTIALAGVSKQTEFENGMLTIRSHAHISEIQKTHLIIIPSLARDFQTAMKGNKPLVEWIDQQHSKGAEIASMCTGTFMLASAGLLDEKIVQPIGRQQILFEKCFPK